MNRIVDQTQTILQYGPKSVWVLLNTVMFVTAFYNTGLNRALLFRLNYFILGSMVIYLYSHQIIPSLLKIKTIPTSKFTWIIVGELLLIIFSITSILTIGASITIEGSPSLGTLLLLWMALIGIVCLIYFKSDMIQFYYERKLLEYSKKTERISAELEFLKSQISPHFLFNTLNKIYGLAIMGDQHSAKMISMLSLIMRYLIYECSEPTVSISKEAKLIKNYLDLQPYTFGSKEKAININFYKEGINDYDQVIPMILINFVENSFKHSDIDTNEKTWISVVLEVEDHHIYFRTKNSKRYFSNSHRNESIRGIGIMNSRKLLQSHNGSGFDLNISDAKDEFTVELNLKL